MKNTIISAILGCCLTGYAYAEPGVWTVWVPVSLNGIDSYHCPIGGNDEMNATIVQRLCYMSSGIPEELVSGISIPYCLSGTEGRKELDIERNLLLLLKAKVEIAWSDHDGEGQIQIDLSETTEKSLEKQGLTLEQFSKVLIFCVTKTLDSNGFLMPSYSYPIKWKLPKAFSAENDKLPKAIQPQKKPKSREQGGAAQPATRPESNSESRGKPQPEAEGHSR